MRHNIIKMFNYLSVVAKNIPKIDELYLVTDVEANGPIPVDNSMLSFSSVAVDFGGNIHGIFYANLKCLKGSHPHKKTMEWWKSFPDQYEQATYAPLDPKGVMILYKEWLNNLNNTNTKMVADRSLDWMYMQWYMVHFLSEMPLGYDSIHSASFAWAHNAENNTYNKSYTKGRWRSHKYKHNHVAINDALGEAFVFVNMLRENNKLPLIKDFRYDDNIKEILAQVKLI